MKMEPFIVFVCSKADLSLGNRITLDELNTTLESGQ